MNERMLLKRIEINPKIMSGKPVIKGTRLPVALIIEKQPCFESSLSDVPKSSRYCL